MYGVCVREIGVYVCEERKREKEKKRERERIDGGKGGIGKREGRRESG